MPNWTEIANSQKFRTLSSQDKEAVRDDFFTRVIAPNVPADNLEAVKSDFYAKSQAKLGDTLKLASQSDGGVIAGLKKGLRDPLDAAAQIIGHVAPESLKTGMASLNDYLTDKTGYGDKIGDSTIDQRIAQSEAEYQAARKAAGRDGIDIARLVGNIGGTGPLAAAKPLQLVANKGIFNLGNIARATTQGSVFGALQPVTQGNFSEEKGKQIADSAMFGAGTAPVGTVLARALNPQVSKEVQLLRDEGVTPTAGQILGGVAQRAEDKFTLAGRNRAVKQFNRAAYARALEGTGVDAKTLPVGREGIDAVERAVSAQYDALLPKLVWKPDNIFNAEEAKITQMVDRLGKKERRAFTTIMDDIKNSTSGSGIMLGDTFKEVTSKLTKDAKAFNRSPDAFQQKLGKALDAVLASMKDNLVRSNPDHAKELLQANRNYANYSILRNAGRNIDAVEGFTPRELSQAVKNADSSVGDGRFARGKAMMEDLSDAGLKVLSPSTPDAGIISRTILGAMTGSAIYNNPLLAGVGAAAYLPYTKLGQKITADLLTKRPKGAQAAGNALLRISPLSGAALSNN